MPGLQKLETLRFDGPLDIGFPKIKSLKVENVTYQGEWVEGDIVLSYELSGDQELRQHIKTKLNEEQKFDIGPLKLTAHVWLDGPKLWFGAKICAGPFCTDELKTSVDLPQA